MLGIDMGYEAHYYGPYSEKVATLNSEPKSLGYVSESSSVWGYDQRGFEMQSRHDFKLFHRALVPVSLIERLKGQTQLWSQIQKAAQVVR